jgi:SAM-dependent methyltransferase
MASELDRINRDVWRSARVRDIFARRDGWMDPGEALVMRRIAEDGRGRAILDIGVGAGRTLPYLRSLSDAYVAIDYLEEMVRLTRSRYPDARVERGDARDLSAFSDASFDLVVFSFNGIDGVEHEDRPKVYASIWRVLRGGGLFAYSTHNLDHHCAGRPPWHRCRFGLRDGLRPLVRSALRLPRSIRAYRRLLARTVHGPGWASLVDPAYDFSTVWHYVTLDEALRELHEAGFTDPIELYTTAGVRMDSADDCQESPWLHYVARKPADARPPNART